MRLLLLAVCLAGCSTAVAAGGSTTMTTTATITTTATATATATRNPAEAATVRRPTDRPYRVMIVGDSVGISLTPTAAQAESLGISVFSARAMSSCSYDRERTSSGGGFIEDQNCVNGVNAWRDDVAYYKPDVVLFMYGSWSNWFYQGSVRTQCDPVMAEHVKDLYGQALSDLGSTGAAVVFVGPAYWRAVGYDRGLDDAYDCTRHLMASFVQAHPGNVYVDLQGLACVGHDCNATAGGVPVREDGLHFTQPGAFTALLHVLKASIDPPGARWPEGVAVECCTDQASVAAS